MIYADIIKFIQLIDDGEINIKLDDISLAGVAIILSNLFKESTAAIYNQGYQADDPEIVARQLKQLFEISEDYIKYEEVHSDLLKRLKEFSETNRA